jgi:hypothetical protein
MFSYLSKENKLAAPDRIAEKHRILIPRYFDYTSSKNQVIF